MSATIFGMMAGSACSVMSMSVKAKEKASMTMVTGAPDASLVSTVTGAASSRFTVAKKSASTVGNAAAQAGWARQAAKMALYDSAGADHHSLAMLRFGGDTESTISERIPCGWSRRLTRASFVPYETPYMFQDGIPRATRRSARSAAFSLVL